MVSTYQPTAKKIFIVGCILGLIGIAVSGYQYFTLRRSIIPRLENYSQAILDKAVHQLEREFKDLMTITHDLATKLNRHSYDERDLRALLERTLESDSDLFGLGIAFKPVTGKKEKLFAPYYISTENGNLYKPIEDDYDYTKESWFLEGLKKAQWLDPYYGKTSDTMIAEYVVPFFDPHDTEKQNPIGVVFANYSLKKIKKLLSLVDLGKTGYATILSQNNKLISHPIDALVKSQKTLLTLAQEIGNNAAIELAKEAAIEKSGMHEYDDPVTGRKSWIAFTTIPITGWKLLVSIVKNEIFEKETDMYRHTLIWLLLSIVFFLASLILYFGTMHIYSPFFLWIYSGLLSALFLSGIGYMWYLQLHMNPLKTEHSSIITDKTSLYGFLEQFDEKMNEDDDKKRIKIPTGLFIRAIDFNDENDIKILGYVWQKYPKRQAITRGFVIPDTTRFEKTPIFEKERKEDTVYSWDFYAKLYQDLDYRTFPFDSKHISMQLKPQEIKKQLLLMPDIDAYNFINPLSLPGIAPKLDISGWSIDQSYFSFDDSYNARYEKIASYTGEKNTPQLYYNIIMRRDFIDPFIAYIIPLLIALFFLFMTLVLISQDAIWDPITLVSAIFFSVIVAHLNLRTKFTGQPVFYLEYFYIITYLMMFATIIVVFLVAKKHNNILVAYKKAIIPKVLYWPFLLFFCFALTVYFFY